MCMYARVCLHVCVRVCMSVSACTCVYLPGFRPGPRCVFVCMSVSEWMCARLHAGVCVRARPRARVTGLRPRPGCVCVHAPDLAAGKAPSLGGRPAHRGGACSAEGRSALGALVGTRAPAGHKFQP